MPTRTFETDLPTAPAELFAWHSRPGAFERLRPPWQQMAVERAAPVENGTRSILRLKKGPFWLRWVAEHRHVVEGNGFTDVQVSGPFSEWIHEHRFVPTTEGGSKLVDHIDYTLPGGLLGRWVAGRSVARDLEATFAYRHATTARDLVRHSGFDSPTGLRVALTGANGLVGSQLRSFLSTGGHTPIPLKRSLEALPPGEPAWNVTDGLLHPAEMEPVDAVVHLAGENIAGGRWTTDRKAAIRDSRVDGTRNLVRSFEQMSSRPRTLVCASAVGFYGSRGEELLHEDSTSGSGFLADTCREWETAALEAENLGIRVVLVRFGIVLSPSGGALAKMLPPFRLGGGGVLGNGRQYMSWVSIDDAVGAIHHALLDDQLRGPVNVTAPRPATNREFTQALGRVLRRPTIFPLPAFGARAIFGEMADEMLLSSARVSPAELERRGFRFDDTDLEQTLARLLGKVAFV